MSDEKALPKEIAAPPNDAAAAPKALELLLVDDSETDAELCIRTLRANKPPY
jgi:hypothetical protein